MSPACYARNEDVEMEIEECDDQTLKDTSTLPLFLKFEDVEYKVRSSSGSSNPLKSAIVNAVSQFSEEKGIYKHILKGIRGSVGPGEMLALMGPSGSGKTTLLKILGGRMQENVSGTITYNGIPYNQALKRRIGFVMQEDVLFPQLTVEETLVFAAFLRLPSSMTRQQKYLQAESTMKELDLERCRHTRIGEAFIKGVSGGERKRTSIGYEILVNPSLLLLDEPTSGLDSTSANRLLRILQRISKSGRTIITTIHQPSSRMFHAFEKIMLIADGSPVYVGKAREAMEYFSSLGFVPELAMNPADFLLDLATGQTNNTSIPDDLRLTAQASEIDVIEYLRRKFKTELQPREKENRGSGRFPPDHQLAVQVKKDWTISWLEQFLILMKRTFRQRCRDYFDKLRLVQTIGVALLLGLLWWNSQTGTETQLRDQVGLLFYICIFWTSSSIFGAVYVFPFEKMYLVKERKADMYRLSAYYVSSTLCDMVAHLLYPSIFTTIVYFMANFKTTFPCFVSTLSAVQLIAITSQGAGELLGAAVMSIKRAGMVASLFLMLFLLTGGYYVQHIPKVMGWLRYASFMHHGFRLLLKVQYSGNRVYDCNNQNGCRSMQSSPSLVAVDLNGGLREVWILLAMALAYRFFACICLGKRISSSPC